MHIIYIIFSLCYISIRLYLLVRSFIRVVDDIIDKVFRKPSPHPYFFCNKFYIGVFEDITTMKGFQVGIERAFKILKKAFFRTYFVSFCLDYWLWEDTIQPIRSA